MAMAGKLYSADDYRHSAAFPFGFDGANGCSPGANAQEF
jgi:hypothetical protein